MSSAHVPMLKNSMAEIMVLVELPKFNLDNGYLICHMHRSITTILDLGQKSLFPKSCKLVFCQ